MITDEFLSIGLPLSLFFVIDSVRAVTNEVDPSRNVAPTLKVGRALLDKEVGGST